MTTLSAVADRLVPNDADAILAAAEAAAPVLRKRSAEIEQNRRLPDDIVALLRNTGVFRMCFARRYGGPELTSVQQTRVIEALAYGDTSAGWCAMVGSDGGLCAGFLSEPTVREVFPSLDLSIAGMLSPAGRAERVPGGFRLTGRWSIGSGITHADRVLAGAFTYVDGEPDRGPGGRPRWRIFLVRPDQLTMIDNWHVTGLAGSGSLDYTIDNVFVPEEHTLSFGNPVSGTGPLTAPDVLMRKMPGVALGTARAALDHVRELARTKVDRMSGEPWSASQRVQLIIGECELDYRTARHAVYGSLEHRWNRLAAGATLDALSPDERIDPVLARLNAFRTARSVVRRLYDLMATSSIYRPSPLDRWLRDLETMCQHVMAQDKVIQTAGAFLIGGTPEFPAALGIFD